MSRHKYKLLYDRFPDRCDLIDRLAREDSDFYEIFQDYALVIEALKKLRISEDPFAESRVKEYRMLRKDLESEIEQFLIDAVKSTSP